MARAQQPALPPVPKDMSALSGVVDDSLRGGRLAGALVTVVGTRRSGVTDRGGLFQIDSIPPGAHQLAVTHPLLDILGTQITSQPFTLAPGERVQVGTHTPSFEEIRAKLCVRGGVVTGGSILVGRVNQADSDEPAVGATVSLLYKEPRSTTGVQRVRTGRVAASGLFAICGLPSTFAGNLQASLGGVTTADLPIKLTDEALATATLSIGGSGRGTAVVRGTITAKSGAPVGGAQVSVVGTTTIAVSTDNGTFTLDGLPSGTHEIIARKIGYAPSSQVVNLSPRMPNVVTVILEEAQLLAAIHVVGKFEDGLARAGFLYRKQHGTGWYLTPEQIQEKNPQFASDLFRAAPGVRLVYAGSATMLVSTRGSGGSENGCVNIFIDRARFDQMQQGTLDDALQVNDIGAIEYYASPTMTPGEFSVAGKSCSTIVAWTKTLLLNPKKP